MSDPITTTSIDVAVSRDGRSGCDDVRAAVLDVSRSFSSRKETAPTGVHRLHGLRSGRRARQDRERARVDVAPGQ